MQNKLSLTTIALILGILVFLIGCIQPSRYEQAKASGYEVEATVVEVVKKEMDAPGGTIDTYTVYCDYTVDGKSYQHVKLENYGSYSEVGETVKIVVDPNNPGKTMGEGGILCVIGFVIAVGALVAKIGAKKRSANTQPQQNSASE